MLVELAERVGPTLLYWMEAPFALALWSFYQLREIDQLRTFRDRMGRLEAAELMHLAFNEPRRLHYERSKLLASVAGKTPTLAIAALRERGERMARFIRKGQVLVS